MMISGGQSVWSNGISSAFVSIFNLLFIGFPFFSGNFFGYAVTPYEVFID
jgi:hypothetical protein